MTYDVDRQPAAFAAKQAQSRERFLWLMFAGIFIALGGAVASWAAGQRVPATLLFLACVAFLYAARGSMPGALNWLKGANAEKAVGLELNELRRLGYVVMHDVMFGGEGNVDHIVSGPNGVFVVETKFRRYELPQLRRLKRQAVKLHDELDHWVVPVMCAGVRKKKPYKHEKVWIAGRGQLVELITGLRGSPADFERLAQFADRLS